MLPTKYDPHDIYIRSTDYDRTITSAYTNLAGLYHPSEYEYYDTNVNWQPIPVHVVPEALDYLLGGVLPPCPAFESEVLRILEEDSSIAKLFAKHKQTIDLMLQSSGFGSHKFVKNDTLLNPLIAMVLVRDSILIEKIHKKQ